MIMKKTCLITGCENECFAKGICRKHYDQEYSKRPNRLKYLQEYYQRPEIKIHRKEYRTQYEQKPEVKERKKEKSKEYKKTDRYKQLHRKYEKERRQKIRMMVLTYYGGNPPVCACCKERHIEFLAVDHINGGGNKHIKEIIKTTRNTFYNWLIKNKLPNGYRVLCHNCNSSLGNYGYCPHIKEKGLVTNLNELK